MSSDVPDFLAQLKGREATLDTQSARRIVDIFQSESDVETQLACLRILRNACASNKNVQVILISGEDSFVSKVLKIAEVSEPRVASTCIQLTHNAFVGHPELQQAHLQKLRATVRAILERRDSSLRNLAASIVLLLMASQPSDKCLAVLDILKDEIFARLLDDAANFGEFAMLSVFKVIQNHSDYFCNQYACLKDVEKLAWLDLASHFVTEKNACPESLEKFLVQQFKRKSSDIMAVMKADKQLTDPVEFLKLLSLLCHLSSVENCISHVTMADNSLVIDAIYLLRMLHETGKSDIPNQFTPISKLSGQDAEDLAQNPIFGFKRDLIRLIGNLCWNHRQNQDQVSGSVRRP